MEDGDKRPKVPTGVLRVLAVGYCRVLEPTSLRTARVAAAAPRRASRRQRPRGRPVLADGELLEYSEYPGDPPYQ